MRSPPTRCAPGTSGPRGCSAARSAISQSSPKSTVWRSCCATTRAASASVRRAATALRARTSRPTSGRFARCRFPSTMTHRHIWKSAARCICHARLFKRSTTSARPTDWRCSPTRAIAPPDRFANSTRALPRGDLWMCSFMRSARPRDGSRGPSGRCWRPSASGVLRPTLKTGEWTALRTWSVPAPSGSCGGSSSTTRSTGS